MTTTPHPLTITPELLAAVAGRPFGMLTERQRTVVTGAAPVIARHQEAFGLLAPLPLAHFLAQTAHESADWSTTTEFASGIAYEGRADLGNTRAGDGTRYKGRGLIQCTGRNNYTAFTAWMRQRDPSAPDFVATPTAVAEMPWAALSALWYWSTRNINRLAASDNLVAVTRAVNGGTNGLDHRRSALQAAKTAIAARLADATTPADGLPVLRRGSSGAFVGRLQEALVAAGYPVTVDEAFGGQTDLAVRQFQSRRRLTVDGIVGPATWRALPTLPETSA